MGASSSHSGSWVSSAGQSREANREIWKDAVTYKHIFGPPAVARRMSPVLRHQPEQSLGLHKSRFPAVWCPELNDETHILHLHSEAQRSMLALEFFSLWNAGDGPPDLAVAWTFDARSYLHYENVPARGSIALQEFASTHGMRVASVLETFGTALGHPDYISLAPRDEYYKRIRETGLMQQPFTFSNSWLDKDGTEAISLSPQLPNRAAWLEVVSALRAAQLPELTACLLYTSPSPRDRG